MYSVNLSALTENLIFCAVSKCVIRRNIRCSYLVEEVLNELSDSDVVVVTMNEQDLFQVFELRNGVVTVSCCLSALLTHDA